MAAITIAVVENAFRPPCNFQDEVATNMTTNVNGWPTMEIQRAICLRLFIRRAIWQIHLVMTSDPLDHSPMAGQGSAGNVIAALCSFFIPGLGQLLQGRLLMAIIQFVLAAVMWIVLLGWLIHLWSILDAALYKPRANQA